jgi:hypothetical protein
MGLGPVGDPFGPCYACTVGAAVKVTVSLNAVADHLHAAILTRGREGVNRTLKTVESERSLAGHAYLKSFRVQHDTHKRTHPHSCTYALEGVGLTDTLVRIDPWCT